MYKQALNESRQSHHTSVDRQTSYLNNLNKSQEIANSSQMQHINYNRTPIQQGRPNHHQKCSDYNQRSEDQQTNIVFEPSY